MKPNIDLAQIAARESEQVEWKANVADPDDVVRTIAAFANDWANVGGGYVVCGAHEVRDEHGFQKLEAVGLTSSRLKEIEGKVGDLCRKLVQPALSYQLEELPADSPDRRILVFVVPATAYAHSYHGAYPVRISRQTVEARNGVLRELLVRKGAKEPWDRRPNASASVDDLDLVELRDFVARLGRWESSMRIEEVLDPTFTLSAMVPSFCVREPLSGVLRPRNGTLLLFGREPQRFAPGAYALFSTYPGADRAGPISERRELTGTLLRQAQSLIELLEAQVSEVLDKSKPEARHIPNYPKTALREAAVNALVHRDYESDQPVRITVFSDRIEFLSPGGLPTGMDPDAFRAGRAAARWRNQSLAWYFQKLQLAQSEGQGIPTIIKALDREGSPPPTFELDSASVTCSIAVNPEHVFLWVQEVIESAAKSEANRAVELLMSVPSDASVEQIATRLAQVEPISSGHAAHLVRAAALKSLAEMDANHLPIAIRAHSVGVEGRARFQRALLNAALSLLEEATRSGNATIAKEAAPLARRILEDLARIPKS